MKFQLKKNIILIESGTHKAIIDIENEAKIIHLNSESFDLLKLISTEGVHCTSDENSNAFFSKHQNLFENTSIAKSNPLTAISLWIQMTDKCNLACDYCYIPSLNSNNKLTKDFFDQLLLKLLEEEQLEQINIKLGGGEPLLTFDSWKDSVLNFKHELERNNIQTNIRIISNMTKLNNEMASYFKENNINLSVSLDGKEEHHNSTRVYLNGKGSYQKIDQNINFLNSKEIIPSIMHTITTANAPGTMDLVTELIEKNVDFRISDVKGQDFTAEQFDETLSQLFILFDQAVSSGYRISKKLIISDLNSHYPKATPCSMGVNGAAIYLNGSIFFCHTQFDTENSIGSIYENNGLVKTIQKGYKHHGKMHSDCEKCNLQLICAGGCPLYREKGKSPMCSVYKKYIPKLFELYVKEDALNENIEYN